LSRAKNCVMESKAVSKLGWTVMVPLTLNNHFSHGKLAATSQIYAFTLIPNYPHPQLPSYTMGLSGVQMLLNTSPTPTSGIVIGALHT